MVTPTHADSDGRQSGHAHDHTHDHSRGRVRPVADPARARRALWLTLGLNAITRAVAVDYAADNIRCNTISPGFVVNERRDADITPERLARVQGMHLTRLGEARDVAYAAVYLASREAEYLTGINLQLDGGSSNARAASLG